MPLKITREISLTSLISAAATITFAIGSAAFTMYMGLEKQAMALQNQAVAISDLTITVKQVGQQLTAGTVKDAEHDQKIKALEDRVQRIETVIETNRGDFK